MDARSDEQPHIFWRILPWFFVGVLTIVNVLSIVAVSYAEPNERTVLVERVAPGVEQQLTYGSDARLSDPAFFKKTYTSLVEQRADFVFANLSTMKLRVVQAGKVVLEVPIATKGRDGSWWETPAGLYTLQTKEEDRFSRMGNVHMPYAMQFSGNFFIHGWPTHVDGTPVSTTFSGGCIRMHDDDARNVYEHVSVGMPVLIYEKGFAADHVAYRPAEPELDARAYLVADVRSGAVFAAKDEHTVLPIASLTKLVTALVVIEHINLDAELTVPASAKVFTSKARLVPGTQVRAYDLLLLLMRESSNEAAETFASFFGKKQSVTYMNAKAASIGLTHTTFTDMSGADAGNTSTAADLFALVRYIAVNRAFLLDLSAGRITNSAYGASTFPDMMNVNDFVGEAGFVGGKNGQTTAAKETGVSVFRVPFGASVRDIVTIVLGTDDRKQSQTRLKEYVAGFEVVEKKEVK